MLLVAIIDNPRGILVWTTFPALYGPADNHHQWPPKAQGQGAGWLETKVYKW